MKIVTSPEHYISSENDVRVFLAGGITGCRDWQSEVINSLSERSLGHLVVFNPRRPNFPIHDKSESYRQIEWEFKMLECADIFSVYFEGGESLQPISLYELGRNILRTQMKYPSDWANRIIIGVEDGYKRKVDVLTQTSLATNNSISINTQIIQKYCVEDHANNIAKAYKTLNKTIGG